MSKFRKKVKFEKERESKWGRLVRILFSTAIFCAVFFILFLLPSYPTQAADKYWVGGTDSWNGTAGNKWATTSGGSTTSTIPTTADNCFFDANSTGTVTIASGNTGCGSIDFTGFTQTLAGSTAISMTGSLTLASSMTNSYTGTITFSSTSTTPTSTITSDGIALISSITVNASNTVQLTDDFNTSSTKTFTLTAGTFDANDRDINTGLFISNANNTRSMIMGSGTWTLTGSNGKVWNTGNLSTLSVDPGTSIVDMTYSGSVGTRGIQTSCGSIIWGAFKLSAGSDNFFITNVCDVASFDFTGFSGTLVRDPTGPTNAFIRTLGDLMLSPTMTFGSSLTAGEFQFISSDTKTFTSNGLVLPTHKINVKVGTLILADDLTTLQGVLIQAGTTLDANGNNITLGLDWTNSGTFIPGTDTVTMSSSSQTISGSTAFNNLIFNMPVVVAVGTGSSTSFSVNGRDVTLSGATKYINVNQSCINGVKSIALSLNQATTSDQRVALLPVLTPCTPPSGGALVTGGGGGGGGGATSPSHTIPIPAPTPQTPETTISSLITLPDTEALITARIHTLQFQLIDLLTKLVALLMEQLASQ